MKKTIKYLLILFTLSGSINSSAQFLRDDILNEFHKKKSEYTQEISFSQFVKELKEASNNGEDYTLKNCVITYQAKVDSQYIKLEPGLMSDYNKTLVIDERINFSEGSTVNLSNCYFDYDGHIRIKKMRFWRLYLNTYSLYILHLDSITTSNLCNVRMKGIKITHSNINILNTSLTESRYNLISAIEVLQHHGGIELTSNKITTCKINNTPRFNISENTISYLKIRGESGLGENTSSINMFTNKINNNIFTIDLRNWSSIRQLDDQTFNINMKSGIFIEGDIKQLQVSGNIGESIKPLTNDTLIEIIRRYRSSYLNRSFTLFMNDKDEVYKFNILKNGNWKANVATGIITEEQLELLDSIYKKDDSLRIFHAISPEIIIKKSEFENLHLTQNTFPIIKIHSNTIKNLLTFKDIDADSILVFNNNTLPDIDRIKIDQTIFKNIGFKHNSEYYHGDEDYHQIKELLKNASYQYNLDELIITHRKFINILNQQGSSAKKTGVLKLKDLETTQKMYNYYKNLTTENWFNWKGSIFLKWYSDYGTNPFKALSYCFWAMLYFAIFYFFFYSDWDKIDRGFLMKRFNSAMDYFTTEKRIEDFYSPTHDKEMTTFTEFKDTLDKNKVYMPSMLASLAKPIYQISLLRYKLLSFSYKKAEFMAGRKWIDLEKKDRYWIGTLTFFLTLTYIIYLIFIRALNSIALSVNAFSTLGFGQIPVRGFTKYVAIIEGFIGWFMLSVFIVSLLSQMMSV
jgi:hypothetical protein